jgi:hypothetical protein
VTNLDHLRVAAAPDRPLLGHQFAESPTAGDGTFALNGLVGGISREETGATTLLREFRAAMASSSVICVSRERPDR